MKRKLASKIIVALIACCLAVSLVPVFGCTKAKEKDSNDISSELTHESTMELSYATGFSVDYYADGYKLITINDEGQFLVVPEGKEAPSDLSEDIGVIQQPVDQIYLVASAAMDMFRAMDSIDAITLTGTKENGWYIDEAKQAMIDGDIVYAGKYSMPDYELIMQQGCDLAIESTMIYHIPEVQESLEGYDIPVLVDQASYEEQPLGRSEWVKLYGAILNKEDAAEEAFDQQVSLFDQVEKSVKGKESGLTVAFFYIDSNGQVNVRKSTDYVPTMITMAGGTYAFGDLVDDSHTSSVTMQMEDFYATAKDADILIYNSSIEGPVKNLDQLLGKSELMENFKAVKNGNVWCTSQSMYQKSMDLGDFVVDMSKVIADQSVSDKDLTYLFKLK